MAMEVPYEKRVQPEATWTGERRKRMRGRFRATLAGLLELEVLRVRHKEMVETALGTCKGPDRSGNLNLQQGRYHYWVEESSSMLKLKRRILHESTDPRKSMTTLDMKRTVDTHSSEDLPQLFYPKKSTVHEEDHSQSRSSSGFCENEFGDIYNCADYSHTISSISTSLASLSYQSTVSDAGYYKCDGAARRWPMLLGNSEEHRGKSESEPQTSAGDVIPNASFLSVVDLYPDSHWPDISNILQPQVVLESSYRSDLKSCEGSKVYRYPSPLHAVALLSPLYNPQSPVTRRKKNGRCSSGSSTWNTSSSTRQGSVHEQRAYEHACCHAGASSLLQSTMSLPQWHASQKGKHVHSVNCRCDDVILKRAQAQCWSHASAASTNGINSLSRRSAVTLHRTCSMGKSKETFKYAHFKARGTEATACERAISSPPPNASDRGRLSTPKDRTRRHTAALTNLNIFMESNDTSCGAFLHRHRSLRAYGEKNTICRGHSFP